MGTTESGDRQDAGMRARVAGKQATAARKAWELEAGPARFRCLLEADGSYVVQARGSKGWSTQVATGTDPVELLRKLVNTPALAGLAKGPAT